MKRAGVRVGAGTRFTYDGEIVQVVEIHTVNGAPEQHVSEAATRFAGFMPSAVTRRAVGRCPP